MNVNYNEHAIKLTNRYLFEKCKFKSHLSETELKYLRAVLSINEQLAKNIFYFANHKDNEKTKDNFLQNFNKYFTFDDRSYKIMGKRTDYTNSIIVGKPMRSVSFNTDYSNLSYKADGAYSYWQTVGKTELPWSFSSYDGKLARFFVPVILKNYDDTVKSLGIQIDKEKLSKHFNNNGLWDLKLQQHEVYGKWKDPNYIMYYPLIKAAYYKLIDESDAKEVTRNAMIPIDYSNIDNFNEQQSLQIEQPSNVQDVTLKFYQSSNVGWMVNMEKDLKKYSISYSETVELSKGIYVDPINGTFHKQCKDKIVRTPKGGGLFDEVGLGKTLCMITLTAANPREMKPIPDNIIEKVKKISASSSKSSSTSEKKGIKCEAIIKNKGPNKGNPCGNLIKIPPAKKEYSYAQLIKYRCCLRHATSIIGDPKNPNKVPEKAEPSKKEKVDDKVDDKVDVKVDNELINFVCETTLDRYNSRATLVICPNQIPYQWRTQIEQYTNPKMKVIMLSSVLESRNVNYLDVVDADFVITTFNALDRGMWDNECKDKPKKLPPISTKIPVLNHFHFHRIVIDEVHEIIDKKFKGMLPKLYDLKCSYKWCVTGTPFKDPLVNYDMMLTWLFDGKYSEKKQQRLYSLIQPNHLTFRRMFRRNTKESVQNVVPQSSENEENNNLLAETRLWQTTSEEIIWLELSEIERAMYNARLITLGNWVDPSGDEYLKQICCSPTLNNENTEVLRNINSGNGAKEIKQGLIKKTQGLIDDLHDEEIPERVEKVWANLEIFKEDVDDKRNRLVYYNSIHHLKRSFLRMYQLIKSKEEFGNSPSYSRPQTKMFKLFKCSSCNCYVCIHEYYDRSKQQYELNKEKSDLRFGVGECGHLFCGKCSFDKFKYKLQLDEVRNKLKNVKKKRKVDGKEEKMGSCVYGFGLCNQEECKILEMVRRKAIEGSEDEIPEYPRKVPLIGLPNALIVQAQSTIEKDESPPNEEDEEEESLPDKDKDEEDEDLNEERVVSPVHDHAKSGGVPGYVTGVFKDEYDCNINLYGTKVTNLIAYLKTYTNEPYNQRVILFSQYDNFLASLMTTLTQFGLACVSCKGNVFSKRKAVDNFKDDIKYRIMLLSSRFSASGLDLIEANKIIFIDPVYGNHKEIRAIETQAIGRAHRLGQKHPVKVVRFLMKNTIEEGAFIEYQSKCLK